MSFEFIEDEHRYIKFKENAIDDPSSPKSEIHFYNNEYFIALKMTGLNKDNYTINTPGKPAYVTVIDKKFVDEFSEEHINKYQPELLLWLTKN